MTTLESAIKDFIASNVIRPLANIAASNHEASADDLVRLFSDALSLPSKGKKRKNSTKSEQKWITYEEYSENNNEEVYLCGYVQTRGQYKDRYCGAPLDQTNTVKWSADGFTPVTVEEELADVDNKREDMRCRQCWSRDPKSGNYKRKKGRGEKLLSEHKSDIVAPTMIPGISIPGNAGLMGFLSGNTNTFQSPTRALPKVIRAKRFDGLEANEVYSHVVPNPAKHPGMPWLIKADSNGQVIVGKFGYEIDSNTTFGSDYVDTLIALDENDIAACKEYNIEYKHYVSDTPEEPEILFDIPVVAEPQEETMTVQDLDIPTIDIDIDDILNS